MFCWLGVQFLYCFIVVAVSANIPIVSDVGCVSTVVFSFVLSAVHIFKFINSNNTFFLCFVIL